MLALSPASGKCLLCLLQELYAALNSSKPGWGFPRKFSLGPTSLGSRTRVCHSVPCPLCTLGRWSCCSLASFLSVLPPRPHQ